MATNLPILLEGSTLGQRHQHFNALVNEAFVKKIDIQSILQAEEKLPIDRLYKIDLASKHRNVEYILYNLKDDDMLYVSRALKAHWLLEPQYRDVINPRHLEEEVFPHMIQPAVNKMRHWLQRNLTDRARCQQFYEHYKDRHEIAIKFLWHCPPVYIMTEINNVLDKLSPLDLKVISENCPQAALVYFDGLQGNKKALLRNQEHEEVYFKSIQCILKKDSKLYLDIVEKYFRPQKFEPLSPVATQYIMKNHKERFTAKPEFYTGYVLHVNTLAGFLNSEEAKDLVLKLARAEDIISFNIFRKVESIIKRVNVDERAAFKKQVFVEKAYGDKLKQWPYPIPIPPKVNTNTVYSIFKDKIYDPRDYEDNDFDFCFLPYDRSCAMKQSCYILNEAEGAMGCYISKSPLDILFDKYRFKGFEETYQDLCKKLLAEGSVAGRMNIFLVLVSKSGGVPLHVAKLLTLLVAKHMNEPSNLRAAVVRSLVKRVAAWRLPDNTWNKMLQFSHDLGLNGHSVECVEGLHAVVLRHFLKNEPLPKDIETGFLKNKSTFDEYNLKIDEKRVVGPKLAKIFLHNDTDVFLEVLNNYKLHIKSIPDAEMTLVENARNDEKLLITLYKRKIGRRYLLKETFTLFKKEESFINALRHDTSVLKNGEIFALVAKKKGPSNDRFLTYLSLYFNEPNGLAEQHRSKLIIAMKTYPQPSFSRAINILSTKVPLSELLQEVGLLKKTEINNALVAAFKATTHKSRPFLCIKGDMEGLKWLGAKAVANKVLICREKDRESYTKLLLQWRRTARIALRLGLDSKSSTETFIAVSKLRPAVTLKIANKTYLRNQNIDPQIWEVTKRLIENILTDKSSKYLLDQLRNNEDVPENVKAEYWESLYSVFVKFDKDKTLPILCRLENMQTSVNQDLIKCVLENFITEELVPTNFTDDHITSKRKSLYMRILAKYLLTSISDEEQEARLKNICDLFFEKIRIIRGVMKDNKQICSLYDLLRNFVHALKYNKAFLGDYTSCYDVFERILDNMKKSLPKEQYFALYLETHLIMIYYQSLRQTIEQNPELFANLDQTLTAATEAVGLQMGRNIGLEVKDITSKYYFSIIDIYKKILVQFLDQFNYYYGENPILSPVFKGLLEIGQTQSLLLAEHVFKKRDFYLSETDREQLMKDLKAFNNKTVNYFLYAK